MPPLEMRGRYLMREYWADSDLFLRLDASEREVLIGLWMMADDAGWLPRDVPAIAATLYRYEDRAVREPRIRTVLSHLRDLGKLESHRCCIYLPSVARYPRAGKRATEHLQAHQNHSKAIESIRKDSNRLPDPTLPLPDPIPNPTRPPGARPRARGGAPRRLGDAMRDVGGFAAQLAKEGEKP